MDLYFIQMSNFILQSATKRFLTIFNSFYDTLYTAGPELQELEHTAANIFDRTDWIQWHKSELKDFCDFRGDFIASDREAAAFVLAELLNH